VTQEDYKQAASLAHARRAIADSDAMAAVLRDLQEALGQERFDEAAACRDAGAGLLGWWAGVEVPCPPGDHPVAVELQASATGGARRGKAAVAAGVGSSSSLTVIPPTALDPRGCLLRVTAAHGRVEGRPHPATAITEIHANVPPSERLAAVDMLTSMQTPVMEMHVQQQPAGGYRTQAVVLCPPTGGLAAFGPPTEDDDDSDGSSSGEVSGTVVFDDVIRSSTSARGGRGGSGASVRIHIVVEPRPAPSGSKSAGSSDDDGVASAAAETTQELSDLMSILTQQLTGSCDEINAGGASSSSDDDADQGAAAAPMPPRRGRDHGRSSAVFVVGQDPQDKAGNGGGALLYNGALPDLADASSGGLLARQPQRVPAHLVWTGRHTFTISYVPPPPAGSAQAAASGKNASLRGGPTQATAPPRRRRGRPPKSAAAASTAVAVDAVDAPSASTPAASGTTPESGVSSDAALSNDDSSASSQPQPGSLMDIVLKKWAAIAQEVARMESRPSGASASGRAALVAAVRDASQTTLAAHGMDLSLGNGVKARVTLTLNRDGNADSSGTSSAKRGGSLTATSAAAMLHRPRKWSFTRLDGSYVSGASADPFTALYVGSFGSHGPELLQLVRGRWGDEAPSGDAPGDPNDYVTAVKLTGDHNVPAGRASFKAYVGPGARLDHHGVYPDELPVLARFKGFGRAARPGFTDPQWVDGELLVLDGGSKDITHGAELGFVWEVPQEKRFLILLGKVKLPQEMLGL